MTNGPVAHLAGSKKWSDGWIRVKMRAGFGIHRIGQVSLYRVQPVAAGCWLHHWLGRGCTANAVSPLPVHWCSFCRPRMDDRLSQPPGAF